MVSARCWFKIPLLLWLVAQLPAPANGAEECTPVVGHLVSIDGQVEVQRGDGSLWQLAELDQSLCERDTIRTGARSRAAVMLINEAVLRLDQQTTVHLVDIAEEEEESSLLDLVFGAFQSFSRSPRVLEVNTPYLNATIEGTEFVVRAEANRSLLTVFEGVVAAANEHGQAQVAAGQSVAAEAGQAPTPYALVRPRDAVQWALYYPPVDAALEEAPLDERDSRFHLREAQQLLAVGRVDEARAAIDRALAIDPDAGQAYALRAVIAVVQNDKSAALADARRAVELEPQAAAPKIALSYAQQASFNLEGARDTLLQATGEQPQDALAWARLAELWLMLGYRDRAREAAEKAAGLAPDLERVHVVSGFAALTEYDTDAARAAFERAIALDSEDPLPHFGLGLAMIRDGALEEGRRNLEVAVGLDSSNALLRSYLGKAYFEEKRDPLDADQLKIAKELDPLDPTPYLYDAIRLQSENRPVAALRELQAAIERNENRAVYRGRQALDEDRAAQGTSLGRIYDDLGFYQLGINEASRSLTLDPANASAHRFLSDSLQGQRRREVSRVSEQLQAQLLQDININPVQPSLSETNLNIATRGGPAEAGFNEFTPLFERDDIQFNATGAAGNNETFTGEGVVSGIYRGFSASAGAFYYDTDGWRQNNDIRHEIYNIYAQAAVTPELSIQGEVRHRDTEFGDLEFDFDPNDLAPNARNELEQDIARVGLRYSPAPHSDILLSYIYSRRDERAEDSVFEDPFLITAEALAEQDTHQIEAQYIFKQDWFNVVTGLGYSNIDAEREIVVEVDGLPFLDIPDEPKTNDFRGYVYANINAPESVTWTVGLSYVDFEEDALADQSVDKLNPKFGVQWDVTPDLRLRGTYHETVKPALAANRTLEPTQIAGFNQVFDDANATKSRRYGVGVDWQVFPDLAVGGELTWRDIEEAFVTLIPPAVLEDDANEQLHQAYIYWTPFDELAVRAGFVYDHYEKESADVSVVLTNQRPLEVETMSVPVSLTYFHPSGFFAAAGVTFVHQEVERLALFPNQGEDDFFVVDVGVGYRFPDRLGVASLQVSNLFDEGFRYQDDSFREFRDEPTVGPYIPERTILGRVTLNF